MSNSALYTSELENFLKCYNTTFLNYDDLPRYNSIFDIFENNNFRILYISSDYRPIGHYVVVLCRTDDVIEFFCSYGYAPDSHNKLMNRSAENKSKTFYHDLLAKTPEVKTIYNSTKLQGPRTNTCGKFCILRILSMKTKLKDFLKLLDCIDGVTIDRFVDKLISVPQLEER